MKTPKTPTNASAAPAPDAAHKPFSWLHGAAAHDQQAQFAALTKDVCSGIQTCLELVHSSSLDHDHNEGADPGNEVTPALSIPDAGRLLMLATAAANMLAEEAERYIDRANERK